MLKWAKDLFPICRSITGQGVRETINYFKKINPELSMKSIKSGTKVFDWIVPSEWNIKNAYIEHESGKRFAEFKKNNLHIIGYSIPINITLTRNQLLKNIYTEKKNKNVIPYITSYYKKRWGFCLSEKVKKKLPSGKYKAVIDSSFSEGKLNYAEAIFKGKLKKEVFLSTYICHPSMANNELSGPVVCNAIQKHIKDHYRKLKYTYRFVYVPETIGSIVYLSKNFKILKKNVFIGFNISCVGDSRGYSHIESRKGNTLSDQALQAAMINKKNAKRYSFLKRQSDERQYCSPGIDLPIATFCKSKYGEYPEYHTSADNFKVVNNKGLKESFELIKLIIEALEIGIYPISKFLCEPHLSKRNLYPNLSYKGSKKNITTRMNILSYADGKNSVFDMAKLFNVSLQEIILELKILKKHHLINTKYY